MVETRTEKDSRRITKKQISFDLDTKVAKAILGKSNYIKAYLDIRKFMAKRNCRNKGICKRNGSVFPNI